MSLLYKNSTFVFAFLVSFLGGVLGYADSLTFKHIHEEVNQKKSGNVMSRELEEYRVYLGKVEADPKKLSHLNPRYPGVVQSVTKSVGDTVRIGEVLASISSNIGIQNFSLKANLSGQIIHRKLAVGEFVDEDRLAFSIANLETVWVNVIIRQSDLKYFKIGQELIVFSRKQGGEHSTGKVFYISPVVDQHTMSATATIEIPNIKGRWKPGQYVDSYVVVGKKKYDLTIDKRALARVSKNNFVSKIEADGKYKKQIVKIGASDLHFVQVISGLSRGDVVSLNPDNFEETKKKNNHKTKGSDKHNDEDEEHQH